MYTYFLMYIPGVTPAIDSRGSTEDESASMSRITLNPKGKNKNINGHSSKSNPLKRIKKRVISMY